MRPIPCIPENAPFTAEQRAWINGFLAGLFAEPTSEPANAASEATTSTHKVLILFGSQTGTAEGLAKKAAAEASKRGVSARVLDMNSYAAIEWGQECSVLLVTSTWGDGDPPDNAAAFWNFLNSETAPRLEHINYSVLALGDRNYSDFCGAGRKFDARLEQLGAKRLHPLGECDTDYEAPANVWMSAIWSEFKKLSVETPAQVKELLPPPKTESSPKAYSKANPFPARLITNRKLNGANSAKETRHFEISLKDSGLNYEVGDALGVMPANCPALADEVLLALKCDGEEAVKLAHGTEVSLRKALIENFQITRISTGFLKILAERSNDEQLKKLLAPDAKTELDKFLHGRELIHLLLSHPGASFSPGEIAELLPKLQARLYSISSSPRMHPGEVHLTVAIVRYDSHGRPCKGVCSTFLADRVDEQTPVPVFVQPSHGFRLPQNHDAPIIMIGPGTGVAPFRAFLEERRAVGARGKNWLFFGDQRRATDFLYADELESMLKDGHLTHLDTAFSRDQADKIYVQQRILEKSAQFWEWLEAGAHVYVCGDAKRMAKDVDMALHQLIQSAGGNGAGQAAEYVQKLKVEKRYQRDVY
ncbi:sulfite reductase subunit alpha [Pedosphaera parvula]|uniref:assimilatory sulfite reductase (NADPH) n=1 Tax=Pedosphaera parvula (strain Ellin514) TaxID=320771 RepID=B9XJ65_PEDPL|nr:sulfite reductase subunit alpha [Pedosphaera parvula]EEF60103.1 FAD-binding domain protein [Pedosphaera parvula Ellin514]